MSLEGLISLVLWSLFSIFGKPLFLGLVRVRYFLLVIAQSFPFSCHCALSLISSICHCALLSLTKSSGGMTFAFFLSLRGFVRSRSNLVFSFYFWGKLEGGQSTSSNYGDCLPPCLRLTALPVIGGSHSDERFFARKNLPPLK